MPDYPLFLNSSQYSSINDFYWGNYNFTIKKSLCVFWSRFVFWGIPFMAFIILNVFLKVRFRYIPFYFCFSTVAELIVEYIFIRFIPRRKIKQIEKKKKLEEAAKKLEEIDNKINEDLKNMAFNKETIKNLVSQYKEFEYPEYVKSYINKLFQKIDMLITVLDDPENYRNFFVNHLPEILNIVVKPQNDENCKKLSLETIAKITRYIENEISQYKLGISMDDQATLEAYSNLYGGKIDD